MMMTDVTSHAIVHRTRGFSKRANPADSLAMLKLWAAAEDIFPTYLAALAAMLQRLLSDRLSTQFARYRHSFLQA